MQIEFLPTILATIVSFLLGMLWYSEKMFGKIWMKINKAEKYTKAELKDMQKKMMSTYALQILMTFITMFILYSNVKWLASTNPYIFAFFMWFGYVMPTQVGAVIWSATDKKYRAKQIGIMIGYQLITFFLAVFIFRFFI